MEKFTPLATNFTLPPGLTGWTNFTSVSLFGIKIYVGFIFSVPQMKPEFSAKLFLVNVQNEMSPINFLLKVS